MPNDTSNLRAEARATVSATVVTSAHARQDTNGEGVTVALRTLLTPTATPAEKRAHLVACLIEAGVLTPEGEPGTGARLTDTLVVGILTKGEAAAVVGMASGLSYNGLASATSRNVGTIKKHLAHAYHGKQGRGGLGVSSMPEAVIAAVRSGAIPLGVILATRTPDDVGAQVARIEAMYDEARGVTPEPDEAPTERASLVPCATEGCTKRSRHASGLCADHR